jgi:hypothetical protein
MLLSLNYALASENITNNNNKFITCGQLLTLSVVQTHLFFEFHHGTRFVTAKQRGEHSAVRNKCFIPY